VVVVVALTVAIIFVGGGRKVRYEIESVDGNAQIISWATDNGGVSRIPRTQGQKVETPWSATVTFQAADQVAAVATDGATGKVSCRIFLNGRQVAESTGRQDVLCQALVP